MFVLRILSKQFLHVEFHRVIIKDFNYFKTFYIVNMRNIIEI